MQREKLVISSIEQWHTKALTGQTIPLRISVNGSSMYPLIRRNRDMVTLLPLHEPLQVGNIVLLSNPNAGKRYVLHRVWQTENGHVLTWGDNCADADHWIDSECVWGKVVLIERGKRSIYPNPHKGVRLAKLWHRIGPLLQRVQSFAGSAKRRMKK